MPDLAAMEIIDGAGKTAKELPNIVPLLVFQPAGLPEELVEVAIRNGLHQERNVVSVCVRPKDLDQMAM